MSDEIFFDGRRFIAAVEAAQEAHLTRDYIARLCKEGKIPVAKPGSRKLEIPSSVGGRP